MSIPLSNYYKAKKTVLIYLDTDSEIQQLVKNTKDKALLITEGRDKIKENWDSKKYPYIIWTYLTNQDDRWVVIVLDTQKLTANIHTASTSEQARKEKAEVVGFLQQLTGLNKEPTLDVDGKNRTSRESGLIAILYITKLLRRIEKDGNISTILVSSFEDPREDKGGKSKLEIVREKFTELETKTIPNLDKLDLSKSTSFTFQNKTIPQIKEEIEKILRETRTKWQTYINYIDPNDINARMFASFVPMARQLLIFINKALESPKELADYQTLNKEWGNLSSDYDNSRDYLNAWYTFRILLNEWEEVSKKPLQNANKEISEADKLKLAEFDKLKAEKEKKDKELERWKSFKTEPRNNLVEELRSKIIQAYNSEEYLNGMYQKLLRTFLTWEEVGSEEQKEAIKSVRPEINNCIRFLERNQNNINY